LIIWLSILVLFIYPFVCIDKNIFIAHILLIYKKIIILYDKYMDLTIFQKIKMALFFILLGPIGHLLGRAIYLNGSLDKIYLSAIPIFWIPPFSLITYFLALFGFIKQAEGENPLNWTLLISFLGNLFIPVIFHLVGFDSSSLGAITQALLMFIVLIVTMFIQEKLNCKSDSNFKRTLLNASIANLIGIILKVVLSVVLRFTPVGWILGLIEAVIPAFVAIKEALMYSIGSTSAVLGTYMYMATYVNSYCDTEQSIFAPIIISIVSLCISSAFMVFKAVSPK
jgi:hypothetical protein